LADLGTLAAGIAHEINSPLQVINGLSERMMERLGKQEVDHERLLRDLENINRNGWRVANIVRSLLTYARASRGEFVMESLNKLVLDTLLLIEHQLMSWSNVSVQTDLGTNLPLLLCDGSKITQLLINLLNNARDAMPRGGTITISSGFDLGSNRLVLSVQDEGSGIASEIRSKIFDPFFTTKTVGSGTGLGLSIVMGIMKAHGGEIRVESAPGKGTTFILYFLETPPQELEEKIAGKHVRYKE
jgi:two-component system, NtrC family, sensor kinase